MVKPKLFSSSRWLGLTCLLISAHFAVVYNTMTTPMVPFKPDRQITGELGPFAFRMLPVLIWKALAFVLAPIHRAAPGLHLPNLNPPFTSNEGWFMVLLTFSSLLGTLLISRQLLRSIDNTPGFEWLALGMAYAAYFDTILVLNRNLFYPYDLLALFFFTLLTYLAFKGRPLLFTAVLVVAMLNKETAIMAVLVYFGLNFTAKPGKVLLASCLGMGVAGLSVRAAQVVYLRHSCPACHEFTQNQLHENLHQLINPLFWLSEVSVYGFAWVAAILFWRYVPRYVQRTFLTVYLLWWAAMFRAGVLREVRIFSELSAVLFLVIALGVSGWRKHRLQDVSPAAAPAHT